MLCAPRQSSLPRLPICLVVFYASPARSRRFSRLRHPCGHCSRIRPTRAPSSSSTRWIASNFANVAELLQARVPGLHVARTGDGGMRWFMRGPSSMAESTPMVLVDDVQMNTAGSAMRDLGTRPPLLDEIDIEDVERIEVWSGPATAIQQGTGAGNGVIRIVTFAPRAQPDVVPHCDMGGHSRRERDVSSPTRTVLASTRPAASFGACCSARPRTCAPRPRRQRS